MENESMTLRIKEPRELADAIRTHVSRADRTAFLSALITGLVTHLYMLVNKLPNHDDFLATSTANSMLTSGRWFLAVPSFFSSELSLPWVNGLISLVFLALTCVLIIRMLGMGRPMLIGLSCALLVAFPSVSHTLCYMYTADAYFAAVWMAVLGVYLADRYRLGFLPGAVLLGLSMGCYQSYIFFAFALLGVKLLLLLTEKGASDKAVLGALARYIGVLALGALVYYGGLQLLLTVNHATLTDYMGINSLGKQGFGGILARIPDVYRAYWGYLSGNSWLFNGRFLIGVFLLNNVLSIVALAFCFLKNGRRTLLRWVLFVLMLAGWPLLFFGIALLGTEIVHTLMLYAFSLVLVILPALADRELPVNPDGVKPLLRQWQLMCCYGLAFLMAATAGVYAVKDNETYFALELKFDNMLSLANRIVDRVEQTPEYVPGVTPIWCQGTIYEGNYPAVKSGAFARASNSPTTAFEWEYGFLMNNLYFTAFVRNYIGVSFAEPDHGKVEEILATDAYESMPYFPEEGSVKAIDGIIFVRVGPGGTVW